MRVKFVLHSFYMYRYNELWQFIDMYKSFGVKRFTFGLIQRQLCSSLFIPRNASQMSDVARGPLLIYCTDFFRRCVRQLSALCGTFFSVPRCFVEEDAGKPLSVSRLNKRYLYIESSRQCPSQNELLLFSCYLAVPNSSYLSVLWQFLSSPISPFMQLIICIKAFQLQLTAVLQHSQIFSSKQGRNIYELT